MAMGMRIYESIQGLLTFLEVINGIEATYHSPPFVYIMADLWREAIGELIEKYPRPKKQ